MSKLQEKPSALKRKHSVLKNMKILDFFLFLWVILPSWIRIQQLKLGIRIRNPGAYTYLWQQVDDSWWCSCSLRCRRCCSPSSWSCCSRGRRRCSCTFKLCFKGCLSFSCSCCMSSLHSRTLWLQQRQFSWCAWVWQTQNKWKRGCEKNRIHVLL